MLKKLISLLLAVFMISAFTTAFAELNPDDFFDADGNLLMPLSAEPITYTMAYQRANDDYHTIDSKELLINVAKDLNIHFEIQEIDSNSWTEKVNIMFASQNLPDVLWGRIDNLANYIDQCYDITDLIPKYTRAIQKFMDENPQYIQGESIGGRMYSFPSVVQSQNHAHKFSLAINQKWLDTLGLAMPKTIDELTDVLRAFVTKDPNGNGVNDEIGFSFVSGYGQGDVTATLDYVRCLFGLLNNGENESKHDIMVENGKVIFCPADIRYYDMLNWLHTCYEEGLIDKDGFTQTDADLLQKGTENRLGFVLGGWHVYQSVSMDLYKNYGYFVPTPDRYGNIVVPRMLAPMDFYRHAFTITKDCKNPEYLIMMLEYINNDEVRQYSAFYGKGGVWEDEVTWNEDGTTDYGWWYTTIDGKTRIHNNNDHYPTNKAYPNYSSFRASMVLGAGPHLISQDLYAMGVVSEAQTFQRSREQFYSDYYYKEMFPFGQMSVDDSLKRSEQFVEIKSYLETFFSDAVINGINESKWDQHLNNLKKLGIDEFISDYQVLYDFLMAAQ